MIDRIRKALKKAAKTVILAHLDYEQKHAQSEITRLDELSDGLAIAKAAQNRRLVRLGIRRGQVAQNFGTPQLNHIEGIN